MFSVPFIEQDESTEQAAVRGAYSMVDRLSYLDWGLHLCGTQTATQRLRPARPPALIRAPAPEQAQGGLQPRPASANRQMCSGWPAIPALLST